VKISELELNVCACGDWWRAAVKTENFQSAAKALMEINIVSVSGIRNARAADINIAGQKAKSGRRAWHGNVRRGEMRRLLVEPDKISSNSAQTLSYLS
jgi:hypothetical protein